MVLDPRQAAAIDAIAAGLGDLASVGVVPFDHVDAITELRELEVMGRQVRARQLELLTQVDQRGLHRFDGHASAKVMVRHVARLARPEAARRAREAAALRDLPLVLAAFAAGQIGVDHLDRIGRAHANPRVREPLGRLDGELADRASKLPYAEFDHEVTAWIRLVDEDGTCDAAERNHANRDFTHLPDRDGVWHTRAHGGSLAGVEIREVFDHLFERHLRRFAGQEVEPLEVALTPTEPHAWPDWLTPVTRCQVDHTVPWNHPDTPGRTSPDNGGPLCGKHNRHKEHGFAVRRDPDGTWHTHRPDGTEID